MVIFPLNSKSLLFITFLTQNLVTEWSRLSITMLLTHNRFFLYDCNEPYKAINSFSIERTGSSIHLVFEILNYIANGKLLKAFETSHKKRIKYTEIYVWLIVVQKIQRNKNLDLAFVFYSIFGYP